MAAVPRPSAPTMWRSVNVARMIVVVPAPGTDDATAVTACSRPKADDGLRRSDASLQPLTEQLNRQHEIRIYLRYSGSSKHLFL